MGDKGSVIIADSGRGVEKGCFQILLDVADFRCVLPHTVKHKADMLAVQFHKLRFHKLCRVVVPRNPYPLSGGAYGFKHEVYNLVKPVTVKLGKLCTTQHRINEDVVLSLVSEMLKAIAEYAKHDRAEFVRVVQEAQSSQQTAEVRKQRTRLATAKQRVSELEVLLCKIYEDNILGKLSDSRYATLDAQYEKEQSELTAEISVLEKAVKSYEKHEKDADRFIALIDKYENFDKLTIAMLNEFIEKILVHERDRKGSIQTTQEVEIYFNFVGRFVPPAFGEVELTPEELEEIRKREERKDRLHQNYLKRKASGAQKRYEDKIKKRKKAEIEAKKAAIRAEDIAKGVFVPVSSLPQREPMKGVQTA